MKTSRRSLLSLSLVWMGLTGCATTPMKPAGFSDLQVKNTLNNLRFTCQNIKVGSPIQVTFYPGAAAVAQGPSSEELTGYFYAFNKMTDTIFISLRPLTMFERGEPYDLGAIQAIVPATALMPQPVNLAENRPPRHDFERDLLTQ